MSRTIMVRVEFEVVGTIIDEDDAVEVQDVQIVGKGVQVAGKFDGPTTAENHRERTLAASVCAHGGLVLAVKQVQHGLENEGFKFVGEKYDHTPKREDLN